MSGCKNGPRELDFNSMLIFSRHNDSEHHASVRLRKVEQEYHSDAVERGEFDEDSEYIESGSADGVPSRAPSNGFPESISRSPVLL